MAPSSTDLVKLVQYIAPVFTPRDSGGAINYDIIPAYVDFLVENGVQGVLVGGTAGQGFLQSTEERVSVLRAFVAAAKRRILIIAHTGGCALSDCVRLTQIASEMRGVDGVMLSPPICIPYTDVSGLRNFLLTAGRACAAETPILYYHFPSLTNLSYDILDLTHYLRVHLPGFVGLKYTATDVGEYQQLVEIKGLKVFLGYPSMVLQGAKLQGAAVSMITAANNYANRTLEAIVTNVLSGKEDRAEELQTKIDEAMTSIVQKDAFMVSLQYPMELCDLPMGPPTPPLSDLSPETKDLIRSKISGNNEGSIFD